MGLIKIVLKLVTWGAAALAALVGVIVLLQKIGVLPGDYTLGEDGPVSLRVRSDEEILPAPRDEIDDDLI